MVGISFTPYIILLHVPSTYIVNFSITFNLFTNCLIFLLQSSFSLLFLYRFSFQIGKTISESSVQFTFIPCFPFSIFSVHSSFMLGLNKQTNKRVC